MDVPHDIICSLLEVPFSRRSCHERTDIIFAGRPVPAVDILSTDKKHGHSFSRSFKTSWYDSHDWLCGSFLRKSLFCWSCLLLSNSRQNVWVSKGYTDLKNLSASLKKHETSRDHLFNDLGLKKLQRNAPTIKDAFEVNSALSKKLYNEDVRKNRILLSYLIDVTVTLAKQELAFRGRDETENSFNCGNFREIFKLLIKRDKEIQEHMKKIEPVFSGLSKTIQNDLIECVADYIRDSIKQEILNCRFFAIQADDTTDINEISQCALSVRFVNDIGEIKERFLGFFNVSEDRTADALYHLISSVLEPYDYKNKLVAQCYDGASVMASSLNGLQMKIKNDAPNALFTHCCAHRLNLVLQNGSKCIKKCRVFFATLTSIPGFFNQSAKRTFVLDRVMGKRIPKSCETRWASRSRIIHIVYSEWNNLVTVFSQIVDDTSSSSDSVNGARGYLKQLNNIEFALLTALYNEIFNITDLLFNILQNKCLDITYCKKQIDIASKRISNLRNDSSFNDFFKAAQTKLQCFEAEDTNPSKRIKLSISEVDDVTNYRALYYEILDNILMQLEVRFKDLGQLNYFSLADSSKFHDFSTNFPYDLVNNVTKSFDKVLDQQKVINELGIIYNDDDFSNLKVNQILKFFIDTNLQKSFSEAYTLFALIATIPATTASVERNFSCLKRIKNYSRNSMSQDRLSSLSLLSIEKALLCELYKKENFMDDIINNFSRIKDRRINLIYRK